MTFLCEDFFFGRGTGWGSVHPGLDSLLLRNFHLSFHSNFLPLVDQLSELANFFNFFSVIFFKFFDLFPGSVLLAEDVEDGRAPHGLYPFHVHAIVFTASTLNVEGDLAAGSLTLNTSAFFLATDDASEREAGRFQLSQFNWCLWLDNWTGNPHSTRKMHIAI